ncbi:MAG TPA: PilZ domain-containing protein [bacterium]|nr:PilZ domain-containing protein [bacterium]
MTRKIFVRARTLDDFKETFISNVKNTEIMVPLRMVGDIYDISTGDNVEINVTIMNIERSLDLSGEVKWKRMKEINLPGKRISAGIGVEFDEASIELIKYHFSELFQELSDIGEGMTGGNYIRVRGDIAKKYNIEKKKSDYSEKRAQPRISVEIPVEIYINNQTKKFVTRDISLLGICLNSDERFPVGEELLVIFSDKELNKQFLIKAVVLRNIPDRDDPGLNYGVGIKFIFEDDKQKKELMRFILKRS